MDSSQGLISGWKPSLDDIDIDAFPSSSSSSSSTSNSNHASSSTPLSFPHQAQKGDPDYIKRPRNSFIIFRCDYVRTHSGTALSGTDKYKRLSKRAADAWRKLPRSKKAEYVQRSAKEKAEHARLYPDYIYRPNKRRSGRTPAPRPEHRSPKLNPRSARRAQVASLLERCSSIMSVTSDSDSSSAPLTIDTSSPSASFPASTGADASASEGRREPVSSLGPTRHTSYSPSSSGSSPLPAWDAPSPSVAESEAPSTPATDFASTHRPLTPQLDPKAQDVYDVYLAPMDGQAPYMPPYGHALGSDPYVNNVQQRFFAIPPPVTPSANSTFSSLADWAGDMAHKPASSDAYAFPEAHPTSVVAGFDATALDTFGFDASYMTPENDMYLNLLNPTAPDFATQEVGSPADLYGHGAMAQVVGTFGDFGVM